MLSSAERAAKWAKSRIDAKLCFDCPNSVTIYRRCLSCRVKRAEYIRNLPYKEKKREIDARRVQYRIDNGLCVACEEPTSTYRCDKCAARHRRYGNASYRRNRDVVLVRTAVQRVLSRLNSDTDKLLLHVGNFAAVGVSHNESKKSNAIRVAS